MMNNYQQQYINDWLSSFKIYISTAKDEVDTLLASPSATAQDKYYLIQFREKLTSRDVIDVEKDLTEGKVKVSTINKIDKLNKDLIDIAWDHFLDSPYLRQSLKGMAHLQEDLLKNAAIQRLKILQIPIYEG